jgi:hypothetical protein
MKYVSKYSLKQLKFVPQEVNSQDYGFTTIDIRKQIQIEEHRTKEI